MDGGKLGSIIKTFSLILIANFGYSNDYPCEYLKWDIIEMEWDKLSMRWQKGLIDFSLEFSTKIYIVIRYDKIDMIMGKIYFWRKNTW